MSANKKIRLVLVANAIPLQPTDFLKHKFFGLGKIFNTHMLCWGTRANLRNFNNTYASQIGNSKVHVLYDKLDVRTMVWLLLKNILLFALHPFTASKLLGKLLSSHGGNFKKIVEKYVTLFPIILMKPDIIHFEFGTLGHKFSDIKRYYNCKISVSFRGYDINYIGLGNDTYYSEVWKNFDGFHFLGRDLKNRAIKRGYTTGKIEVLIPPAIDTSFFRRKDSPIPKHRNILKILSIGRLTWKKGYEYGIRSVSLLKDNNIPFEYRIIGDGEYLQSVQFTINELNVENEVILLGKMNAEAIKAELENADVFLHPAISEGFCNAVIEAQAMGLPVICSDADGLSENVVNDVTGYVVPKWDVNAMADKLEWCWLNQDASLQMGKNGMARANKYFKLEDQIKSFEQFYQKLYES